MGKLKGKKTYVTAALGVLGAAAAMATGDMTAVQGVQSIFGALLAVFIRDGMQ